MRFLKYNKPELVIVTGLIGLATLMSLSQTLVYYFWTPAGSVYPFVHNYIEDYYYYLHLMRQGWEGQWLATSWLTPEPSAPQFVNPWLLFLGQVARWFKLSLPLAYTLARGMGAISLYFLSYLLIWRLYPQAQAKRMVALLVVIFGTYWWGWGSNGPAIAPLVQQWTVLDPLFRASFIPHHLWSKIFMLVAFLLFLRYRRTQPALGFLVGVTVAVGLLGFTSPVTLATFIPVMALWFVFEYLNRRRGQGETMTLAPWVLTLFLSLAIAFYHRTLERGVFPWNSYQAWEDFMRYPVSVGQYLQSLGPQLIFFLLALPWLWRAGGAGRLLLAWVATSWLLLFVVSPFIPLSNTRFLDGYQFIPIGIGAAEGIWIVARAAARLRVPGEKMIRLGLMGLLFAYFAIGVAVSWQEHQGYIEENKFNPQVYVSGNLIEAFRFLEKQTPKDAVILAPYSIGTMIPAFTGKRVVAGHQLMTLDSAAKQEETASFYRFIDIASAKRMVERYHVGYILAEKPWGLPQPWAGTIAATPVFDNGQIIIYRVGGLRRERP